MKRIVLIVNAKQAGRRLDRFLADACPDLSRAEVQRDVRAGHVSVSGDVIRQPSRRLRENETVTWEVTDRPTLSPRPIPLDVLYEDDHLVVVDKPTGLVVHPGAGTDSATLVEGLLADRTLPPSDDPVRPGIVHRLDKETSGVIVVAKTAAALVHLQRQFAARAVAKSYLAVVSGAIPEEEGTIDAPIGRDPAHPRRMSVQAQGRPAETDFRVLTRFDDSTLLLVRPHTGRTHQVRVHLRYIGHPVVGDLIYGPSVDRETAQGSIRHSGAIAASKKQPNDILYGATGPREQAGRHTSSQRDPYSEGAGGRSATAEGHSRPTGSLPDGTPDGTGEAADVIQGRSTSSDRSSRMLLHAWRIALLHPETGETVRFEAPVPDGFPPYSYNELPYADLSGL